MGTYLHFSKILKIISKNVEGTIVHYDTNHGNKILKNVQEHGKPIIFLHCIPPGIPFAKSNFFVKIS